MPTKIRDLDSFLQRLYQCGPQPTRFLTCSNHCHWTCAISQWKWIINGDQQFPIGNHEFHGFPNCCRLQLNAWLCSASLFVGKEPTAIYGIFVRITALCVFFMPLLDLHWKIVCEPVCSWSGVQSDKIMLALVGPTTPTNKTVTNHCIPV